MIQGHTHDFTEVLRDDKTGTELRCQCGARLWEPASALDYLSRSEPKPEYPFVRDKTWD